MLYIISHVRLCYSLSQYITGFGMRHSHPCKKRRAEKRPQSSRSFIFVLRVAACGYIFCLNIFNTVTRTMYVLLAYCSITQMSMF